MEIFADRIRLESAFNRVRECPLAEIDGFRIVQGRSRYLKLIPTVKTRAAMKIELVYERQAELLQWVKANLRDLDAEEVESEMKEMLSDDRLGMSEDQRSDAAGAARRWVAILNMAALAALSWATFAPRPYRYALAVLAALPVMAPAAMLWFRGVVRFNGKRGGAHSGIAPAYSLPAFVLAMRGFFDCHILTWSGFWVPFLAVSVGLAVWTLVCAASTKKGAGTIINIVVISLIYSYGLVVHLNCFYDRSRPAVYQTNVESRHISRGRSPAYHLALRPWLDQPETEDVTVPRSVYDRHPEGSPALVVVRDGALKMEWYYVR